MSNIITNLYNVGYTSLRTRQAELNTIAENLANINTPAFKERTTRPQGVFADIDELTIERGGVTLGSAVPDFRQGPLQVTGETWDLAVDGPGLFALRLPDGRTGYTRLGLFRPDSTGRLVSEQGYALEPALTVPAGVQEIMVDQSGVVTGTQNGLPQTLGRLQLSRFPNPEGLVDQGDGIYLPSVAAGAVLTAAPGENGMGQIRGGALEMTNVDAAQQMINMLQTQRAYSLTLRALQVSDQMLALTNQLQA